MKTPKQLITPTHLKSMGFEKKLNNWAFDFLPEFMDAKYLALVMGNELWYPIIIQWPEIRHKEVQIPLNEIKYTHELERIFICIVGEEEFDRVFGARNVQDLTVRTEHP